MRPLVLHAHFYQPERVNPWTGVLDPEPSAAPHRDWNERILLECYRPNGAARIFDEQRRVERIVNNYERLSFNFGPTLLSWMERRHPATYAKVLDGDWRSAVRTGHGNALAQAYNHMILPLADDRDRRTQVQWGLADFRHRFARDAEGLWLPETAVDQRTIDVLIDAGVRFTVLAPSQAARVEAEDGTWQPAASGLDTSTPYQVLHSDGSGRDIAVFFYDGDLAQAIAFDPATASATVLLDRIKAAGRGRGLVHAAMDGETFGHHNTFAELGLAYSLFELAEREGLEPTNYAAFLEAHPPTRRAELVDGEGTAWSCAHGVGRWYRDCGCSTDALPGWNQAWRTPLRAALDVVRGAAATAFDEAGGSLLKDPWAARDDYVHVRLGRWTRQSFLDRHAPRHLSDERKVDLWSLLEAQRHAMVMYTSCGWFFADVAGIETVYVLRSAARVLGLLQEVGGVDVASARARVLETLATARSNQRDVGTGADVWRERVESAAVTPSRVCAHMALLALTQREQAAAAPRGSAYRSSGHTVTVHDRTVDWRGRMALATGRASVASRVTGRTADYAVALLHLGGLDFHGYLAPDPGPDQFDRAIAPLWAAFPTLPMAKLIRLLSETFALEDAEELDLDSALPAGRQLIVGAVFADLTAYFAEQQTRLYTEHRRTLEMLTAAGYALPAALRAPAELTLAAELDEHMRQLRESGDGLEAYETISGIVTTARTQGYRLDLEPLERALSIALTRAAEEAAKTLEPAAVETVSQWLRRSGELGVDLDIVEAQEHAYSVAVQARAGRLRASQREQVERFGAMLGLAPRAWSP